MRRFLIPAVAVTSMLLLAACGGTDGSEGKAESTSAAPSSPARLTASVAVDKLAAATGVLTLGQPSDNTGACSSKETDGKKEGCVQLITTDTVSVYEFETPDVAAHWVKTMTGDWRQVDRFALAWTARNQDDTSKERRDELEAAMAELVADPSGRTVKSASAKPSVETSKAEAADPVVPNVVGMVHSDAMTVLHTAGFMVNEEDASPEGRWIINNSNWKVCRQSPEPGASGVLRVAIYSVKIGESC